MNIFVLHEKPAKAAMMLCDCHLRKMCVETAQILSGVMLRRGIPLLKGMPRPQNINHPVIAAVDLHPCAFKWTVDYNEFLHIEFLYRFGKTHSYNDLKTHYSMLSTLDSCKPDYCNHLIKCCGDLDTAELDIISAYKKYYVEVKKPTLIAKKLWHFTERKDWTE